MGELKSPNRPKQKHVARRGHGKSPCKVVVEEEKAEESEVEERPVKKREEDPPEAFQYDQSFIRLSRHPVIQRAVKWFERNHPFVKVDRGQDLFPAERAKASAEALVP